MPGETGATVVTNSCGFYFSPREAAGALKHPAFPTPSLGEGYVDNSGVTRRGDVRVCLNVIARSDSDEAIQSFFPVAVWIASLALAMTVRGLVASWLFDR